MRLIILLFGVLLCAVSAAGEGLTLNLDAGKAAEIEIPDFKDSGSAEFSLALEKFNRGTKWKPYINYSLIMGAAENSFRVGLIESESKGPVIAVAQYYKDGVDILQKVLVSGIPIGAKIDFSLSWDANGNVRYSVMGGDQRTLETHLKFDRAEVLISNAKGTFYPDR